MDAHQFHAHQPNSHPLASSPRPLLRPSPNSVRPISIRGARENPPPPLPPPRHILTHPAGPVGHAPAWRYLTSDLASPRELVRQGASSAARGSREFSGPPSPLRSSPRHSHRHDAVARDGTSTAAIDPAMLAAESGEHRSHEDTRSTKRRSLSNYRFQSENNLGRREVYKGAQAYDRNLLSKISGPNTASANGRFAGQLKPLVVTKSRATSVESPPSQWRGAPSVGISPSGGFRAPWLDQPMADASLTARISVTPTEASDDAGSTQHSNGISDGQSMDLDPELTKMDVMDMSGKHPYYGDEVEQVGLAMVSSSPSEADHMREDRLAGGSDWVYRPRSAHMLAPKTPSDISMAGYHGASVSSSLGTRHGSSYASTWNPSGASSLTSLNGVRLSPSPKSPPAQANFGSDPLRNPGQACQRSSRNRTSQAIPAIRKFSDIQASTDGDMNNVARKQVQTRQAISAKTSAPKAWDGYSHVCRCCPNKPKRFDNEEELRLHELEKQYQCAYCPNRFKNKNEAERHQNSLHLRRQSWSCAALASISKAFHPSSHHATTFDVCGYCGKEFPNPANWSLRSEHLLQQHKFGECNRAKKFFRADHFRQHLRHSHTGTSGKWTNVLEAACMREEQTPPPLPPRNLMAPAAPMMAGIHSQSMLAPSVLAPSGTYQEAIIEERGES